MSLRPSEQAHLPGSLRANKNDLCSHGQRAFTVLTRANPRKPLNNSANSTHRKTPEPSISATVRHHRRYASKSRAHGPTMQSKRNNNHRSAARSSQRTRVTLEDPGSGRALISSCHAEPARAVRCSLNPPRYVSLPADSTLQCDTETAIHVVSAVS